MELISAAASPFVRKVRVLIREAGATDHVTETQITTTPLENAPEAVTANPLGRIPSLIRQDGPTLYDSRVITRYLDHTFKAGLYPEGRLWEVLTLEATADGICDSAVSMAYEARLRGDGAWEPWLDAQWEKVERALDAIDTRWMSHLAGPLNMGQIGVACALGYLDLRHDARGWRTGRQSLSDWYTGFAERPSMKDTAPV